MKRLLDHTLRGYGQMLVANSRITGVCVLIGLFVLSTETALMSLGGALLSGNVVPGAAAATLGRPQAIASRSEFGRPS